MVCTFKHVNLSLPISLSVNGAAYGQRDTVDNQTDVN